MNGEDPLSDPIQSIIGVKLSIAVAALLGAITAAITGTGHWFERTSRLLAGFCGAIYFTPFVVEAVTKVGVTKLTGPAVDDAVAFVCGYIGIGFIDYIIQQVRRRLRIDTAK